METNNNILKTNPAYIIIHNVYDDEGNGEGKEYEMSVDELMRMFVDKYGNEIREITGEDDLSEFGLGSKWLFDLPFILGLKWCAHSIYLTIEDCR